MAKPRMDTKDEIVFKHKIYIFYGYAPDMNRAVNKAAKKFNRDPIFLNTGYGNEIAIYILKE